MEGQNELLLKELAITSHQLFLILKNLTIYTLHIPLSTEDSELVFKEFDKFVHYIMIIHIRR